MKTQVYRFILLLLIIGCFLLAVGAIWHLNSLPTPYQQDHEKICQEYLNDPDCHREFNLSYEYQQHVACYVELGELVDASAEELQVLYDQLYTEAGKCYLPIKTKNSPAAHISWLTLFTFNDLAINLKALKDFRDVHAVYWTFEYKWAKDRVAVFIGWCQEQVGDKKKAWVPRVCLPYLDPEFPPPKPEWVRFPE